MLDEENVRALLANLSTLNGSARSLADPATRLALLTGMREGEICASRFRDVDVVAMEIHVRRAMGEHKKTPTPEPQRLSDDDLFGFLREHKSCSILNILLDLPQPTLSTQSEIA